MTWGMLHPDKYAASSAATTALSEPLIPDEQSTFSESDSDDGLPSASSLVYDSGDGGEEEVSPYSDEARNLPKLSLKDVVRALAVSLLVACGLAASAFAAMAARSIVVFLSGGICVVNSLVVAHRHVRIAKSEVIRESVNTILKDIEFLKGEIDFLVHSVDDLQAESDVLIGLEEELRDIAGRQGKNIDHVVDLVNENELILSEMKGNLRQVFVFTMIQVIMQSDTYLEDGNTKIDTKKIPLLAMCLQIRLKPYGIKLDTNMFNAMILEDNDISNVMKFCGNMLFEGEPNANDDDDSVDSKATIDFESFWSTLDEENHMDLTFEEKVGMAAVDEGFSGGSVEVARGGTMTLAPRRSKKEMRRKTIVREVRTRRKGNSAVRRAAAFV